jgi:hypothetical protein
MNSVFASIFFPRKWVLRTHVVLQMTYSILSDLGADQVVQAKKETLPVLRAETK